MADELSDEGVERILTGRDGSRLAGDLARLREAFVAPPSSATASRHMAALTAELERSDRSVASRVLVAIGAVGALLILTAGMASADLLPKPVQEVVDTVLEPFGIDVADPVAPPPAPVDGSPSDTAPGQVDGSPSDTAPGQVDGSPSDTAPGQVDGSPSDTAPGQVDGSPSDTAPGQVDGSPSDTAPGPANRGENGNGRN